GVHRDTCTDLLEDRIPGLAAAAVRGLAHRLDARGGRRGGGRAGRRQSRTRLPLGLRRGPSEYRDGLRRDPHADRGRRHSLSRRDPGGAARAPLPAAARAQRGVTPLAPSSPRKRGPIFQRRWLWVPAFAGTTADECEAYQFLCVSRKPSSTIAKPTSCARVGTSPSTRKPMRSVNPGTSDGKTAARPAPSSTTERVKR